MTLYTPFRLLCFMAWIVVPWKMAMAVAVYTGLHHWPSWSVKVVCAGVMFLVWLYYLLLTPLVWLSSACLEDEA